MPITRNTKLVSNPALADFLAAYEEGTTVGTTGISYERRDFREFYEILPDAFTVRPAISRQEAIGLFRRALLDCRRVGPLTADAIITRATAIQHEMLAVPRVPYTLWTKFRALGMANAPGIKLTWRGVRIRTAWRLPGWLEQETYLLNGVGYFHPRKPEGSGHIIAACDDRDENRAVERMLDALQLVYGLVNLYETWGGWPWSGGRNWTDGGLWMGQTQYVFRRHTFRGTERIWYNADYDEETWNRHPRQMSRIRSVLPTVQESLAALNHHPLSELLIRAILLMQEGFATRDSSVRLLRYWSALEQLYVEPDARGRSNDKVLERALFAESEPRLSRWKLEHIARLRNAYVHAGGTGDDLHDLCLFLRSLLARHIHYWIMEGQQLANHAELLNFAKLPTDRAELVAMRDTIDRRLAFMNLVGNDEDD